MQVQLAEQTRSFIYAAALGLCLGGVYDFLRCLRALSGAKRWVTALCDLLFSFLCMLSYFLFSLTFCGGVLRLYTALGAGLAMLLYFLGISPLVMAALLPPIRLMRRGLLWLGRRMRRFGRRLSRHVRIWFAWRPERGREGKSGSE